MLKIIKKYPICAEEVLTIVGEDYWDIYKANEIKLAKDTCKKQKNKKIQVNEYK